MHTFQLKDLAFQTMLASMYVVLVFGFSFMSFETIQFRIAEVLLIFIFFDKKSIVGLTIGTFVANWLMSPFGIIDAVFGSLATVLSLTAMIFVMKSKIIALVMPALFNGFIIGFMLVYFIDLPFLPTFGWIFLGEAMVMFGLGYPFYQILSKNPAVIEFFHKK
ncbi:MAG: QueT transporter family protein [Acholeplasmataceae bacterium]